MRVTVRNRFMDMAAFVLHIRARNRRFARATDAKIPTGRMNLLARQLHPSMQRLTVTGRRDETPSTATFTLEPEDSACRVAHFRAGQYLVFEVQVGSVRVSRPFSISNSPDDSLAGNRYEITIRSRDDGFFAPWVLSNWREGTRVAASDPQGFFHFEGLRDFQDIVCLAGGSGITPFRSVIRDLLSHEAETQITLLYGATSPEELIFGAEWEILERENPKRFRFIPVYSKDPAAAMGVESEWSGERGFLSAELVGRYCRDPARSSFFICGPEAMHRFLDTELQAFNLRRKQVRRENFGGSRPLLEPSADGQSSEPGRVTVKVSFDGSPEVISAPADCRETVLVALERAGLNPPAMCRSGECGWCRGRLLSGSVRTPAAAIGVRAADARFSYFHPCNSWPESDLVVRIPRNPRGVAIVRGGEA